MQHATLDMDMGIGAYCMYSCTKVVLRLYDLSTIVQLYMFMYGYRYTDSELLLIILIGSLSLGLALPLAPPLVLLLATPMTASVEAPQATTRRPGSCMRAAPASWRRLGRSRRPNAGGVAQDGRTSRSLLPSLRLRLAGAIARSQDIALCSPARGYHPMASPAGQKVHHPVRPVRRRQERCGSLHR